MTATYCRLALTAVLSLSLALFPCRAGAQTQPQPTPPPPSQPQQQPPAQPRQVVGIEVRGNTRIPASRILAAVTRTKVGEPLSEEAIREDLRAINELGVFADVTVRTETEADGVRVVFIVTENPVVAEVIIEGHSVVSADDLRRALGVPTGEVLNLNQMREGTRAIQQLYEDRGYVLARVSDTAIVPVEGPADQARLRLRVAEGTVEAVRFEGLRKTRLSTALRHIRETRAGAVFNVDALNRDLQRLFDTGLFEAIRARPEPGTEPDAAVVVIEVTEARTGQIGGGVGYSSTEGLLGFIEYRDRNWMGQGQTFAVRAERGVTTGTQTRTNYELSFSEPFLDPLRTSLDLSLFSRSAVEQEYSGSTVVSRFDLQRTGSAFTLSRPLDGVTTASLRLKSERADIIPLPLSATDPASPIVPPSMTLLTPGRVVSLLGSAQRDTRDDRLRPRRGERIGLSAEFGLPLLGSDFGFMKYTADYQRVFPAGRDAAIVGRIFLGTASGTLPAQEQFLLGGSSTVRAFPAGRFRENSMIVMNLEYRFSLGSLIRQLGDLQGILFVDAGNAPLQFTDLKVGYGVGVAVSTPVGPIRIDLAFGPEGQQTWISLGAPF